MTKYDISGHIIEITNAQENQRQYQLIMDKHLKDVRSDFETWYSKQHDVESVYDNYHKIMGEIMNPILDEGVELLHQCEIYTIDRGGMFAECKGGVLDDFEAALESMLDRSIEIELDQQEKEQRRRMRKASREKFHGSGIGLAGTMKAKAEAGALNIVSGTAYSLFNMVGNAGSAIAAGVNKKSIYSDGKQPLTDLMDEAAQKLCRNIRSFLEKKTNLRFKVVTVSEASQAKAILENYQKGIIPDEKKFENIVQALELNPYNFEIYKVIWNDYYDLSGDLIKMADYFGKPLEEYVYEIAVRECDAIFQTHCSEYLASDNPILAAVNNEERIKTAYTGVVQYVRERNLKPEKIELIARCEKIFEQIEDELKMVDGVQYGSRQEAEQIRKDKQLFYCFLESRDIRQENVRKELCSLAYISDLYRENIHTIVEEETDRRNPVRVYNNLKNITKKYFPDGSILSEVKYVDFSEENFPVEKELMIRKVTEMPPDEGIILFFDESNKGKRGLLFTNENFRIFEKGAVFGKNHCVGLDQITEVECLGKKKYLVRYGDEELTFSIKGDFTLELQNQLGKCLQETCFVLQNLEPQGRKNLAHLSPGSTLCECGAYIPDDTKVCTNCWKKDMGDGTFVNTVPCPSCGFRLVEGKRFCTNCGTNMSGAPAEGFGGAEDTLVEWSIGASVAVPEEMPEKVSKNQPEEMPEKMPKVLPIGTTVDMPIGILNDLPDETSAEFSREGVADVDFMKTVRFCTQCGNKVKEGKKFCMQCGAEIKVHKGSQGIEVS